MTREKDKRINVGAGMVPTYHATESIEEARAVVESCCSATEELRRMLSERGEYYRTSGNRTWWGRPIDTQTGKPINVFHNQAQPMGDDRLFVELQLATPEQAIAATLGPGTCKLERASWDNGMCTWGCICSACDAHLEHETGIGYNFCPICGAKVVSK